MQFDKCVVNASIYNDKIISSRLEVKKGQDVKWKSSYFDNINNNNENAILNFLENANDTFEGIDLVLSFNDESDQERKKKLGELTQKIIKHCKEKIQPPVEVCVYEHNKIEYNVFKYMNLFYEH